MYPSKRIQGKPCLFALCEDSGTGLSASDYPGSSGSSGYFPFTVVSLTVPLTSARSPLWASPEPSLALNNPVCSETALPLRR